MRWLIYWAGLSCFWAVAAIAQTPTSSQADSSRAGFLASPPAPVPAAPAVQAPLNSLAPALQTPTPTPVPPNVTASPSTLIPAPDTEIKFSGDFRVRYESDLHANAQSASQNAAPAPSGSPTAPTALGKAANQAGVEHRLKLNVFVRHGEDLQAGATLINAAVWGERPATGDSSTDPNSSQIPGSRSGAGTNDNMILVNRAWGWWKASDTLSFKFGRVGLEMADGSVFSENDWEQFPVSHDGLLSFWDSTIGRFTLFVLKNNEFGTGFLTYDAERVTYGISFDVKNLPSFISMANFHVLQIVQGEAYTNIAAGPATQKENSERLGVAVGGDAGGFNYKIDGVYAFGKTSGERTIAPSAPYVETINSWMVDVSGGYKLVPFWALKLVAGIHKDSGDHDQIDGKSQQYEPLYYNRHDNAGLMDVLNWGNLTYYDAGLTGHPREDLEAGLMYYWFQKTSAAGATNYGHRYVDAGLPAPTGGGEALGSEIDLFARKSFAADLFHVGLRADMFIPGASIRNSIATGANSNMYELFAEASMVF